MSNTGADLRTYLLADATVAGLVGTRVFQTYIPGRGKPLPFVWFTRRGFDDLDLMGPPTDDPPFHEYFDLEAVAADPVAAETLAAAVTDRLNGTRGTIGDGEYNHVHVRDQADDYETRNTDANDQLAVTALDIEVTNL